MGFITTLTANNDTIHRLPGYPDLGDEIYHAILDCGTQHKQAPVGNSGIIAHESHDAAVGVAVLIGGMSNALVLGARVLSTVLDPELQTLSQLADKHGSVLHKKVRRP
jgi:hypothetical protein